MISIAGKRVVINETVLLKVEESSIDFEGDHGLRIQVLFRSDGTSKPSIAPDFAKGVFRLPLNNFGSTLGMAVGGTMTAQTSQQHPRPGAWMLSYALVVHLIGENYRSLQITVSEARIA